MDEESEVSDISDVDSESFIDDQEVSTAVNFYRHFANVENDIEQVLKDTYNEAIKDFEKFDEISNLFDCSEDEAEIDNSKNFELDIKKFNEILFPRVYVAHEKVENRFYNAILYVLRFDKTELKNVCNKEDFEKIIDESLVEELNQPEKFKFMTDLQKIHNLCYEML